MLPKWYFIRPVRREWAVQSTGYPRRNMPALIQMSKEVNSPDQSEEASPRRRHYPNPNTKDYIRPAKGVSSPQSKAQVSPLTVGPFVAVQHRVGIPGAVPHIIDSLGCSTQLQLVGPFMVAPPTNQVAVPHTVGLADASRRYNLSPGK